MPDCREYLRLEEGHEGCEVLCQLVFVGFPSGSVDAPATATLMAEYPAAHLTTERATALRDALTQWLMDVEVSGG